MANTTENSIVKIVGLIKMFNKTIQETKIELFNSEEIKEDCGTCVHKDVALNFEV